MPFSCKKLKFGSLVPEISRPGYSRPVALTRSSFRFMTPVGCYQPPLSASDRDLWSSVHRYCLTKAIHVVRKILPNGRSDGHLLRDDSYIVALKRIDDDEVGWELNQGGWVCLRDGCHGETPVELYAHENRTSFTEAIYAIAGEARLIGANGELLPDLNAGQWREDRQPLHPDFALSSRYMPLSYPRDCEEYCYRNALDHTILRAFHWPDAEGVPVYRTLQRNHRTHESRWAEIFSHPPHPLYNEPLIRRHSRALVILVEDEARAEALAERNPERVYSTVPGGLVNLPFASLELLRGRSVTVEMNRGTFPNGKLIRQSLHQAGVSAASFSLLKSWNTLWHQSVMEQPFEFLEEVAERHGYVLRPIPAESEAVTVSSVVITRAGEPIARGQQVRQVLLSPIISEGYLVWMYGEPKCGKSWMGQSIAHAVAMGNKTIGPWRSKEPCGVLLVDGENFPDELEESIHMVRAGAGDQRSHPSFNILCARSQPGGIVDIVDPVWQSHIKEALREKKLLILDNIQSLTNNAIGVIDQLVPWFSELMQDGIAILVLDHTNRDGELQGSARKERAANLSIALRYPDDSAKADGRILVEYPVARRLHGDDAQPFQLKKIFTKDSFAFHLHDGSQVPLCVSEKIQDITQVVFARDHEHLTYEQITAKYEIPKGTAHGRYEASKKLVGTEKAIFDTEMNRLTTLRDGDGSPTP